MIYTIIFYLLIAFITTKNKVNPLKWACVVVAIYYGIRYNYMPDYESYHRVFNMFSSPSYEYDSDYDHMEIGWFYLNKLFAPFGDPYGFFAFVLVCSIIFAYGIYRIIKVLDIDRSYLPMIMVGYFTVPTTAVLCSAQRQFLVTGIFLIAYSFLIYDKIDKKKDLFSKNALLYYVIILLTTTLHSSSIFLLLIPFAQFIPSKSRFSSVLILLFFVFFIFTADEYLPMLMQGYMTQTDSYEYMEETFGNSDLQSITLTAIVSFVIQIAFCAYAVSIKSLNKNEVLVIVLALLGLMFSLSGYYVQQLNRIGLYISIFTYISMAVVSKNFSKNLREPYMLLMWIFIIWNVLKVFQPVQSLSGRDISYKTIFEALF